MRRELTVWSNEWTVFGGTPFSAPPTRIAPRGAYICPLPLPPPRNRPLPACPSRSLRPTFENQVLSPSSALARASRLSTFFVPTLSIHITTTNYTQPYGHPSLLAGLLNGYNLALFTTRAARSPVWQVSPQRSFLWEANRRRSLSSPASKSKIILSLGFLTAAINRSSESRIIFIYRYFQSFI